MSRRPRRHDDRPPDDERSCLWVIGVLVGLILLEVGWIVFMTYVALQLRVP